MGHTIGIYGAGLLKESTKELLQNKFPLVSLPDTEMEWQNIDLLLILHDYWCPSIHREIQEKQQSSSIPWIRAFLGFGEAIIGPLQQSDDDLCFHCADRRLLMGGKDRKEMWSFYQQWSRNPKAYTEPWASKLSITQVSLLIQAEVTKFMQQRSSLTEELILVHLHNLQTSRQKVIADPLCPICTSMTPDNAESALISLQPNTKEKEDSFRVCPFSAWENIKQEYYGDRTGVFHNKIYDYHAPFAAASVQLPLYTGSEATAGRTHQFQDSVLTAIFEGLERSCGIAPRSKQTIIHDSYHRIALQAMHPESVGVHSKEQYSLPDFPFQAFDPYRKMNWVWGYSLVQERPILVPELLAYYSMGGGKGFVYETSNGCALGGSLEESIFHGILEVLERDAFLMTWYARLALPRIDPYSSGDQELAFMLDRIDAVAGYEIHLFNATMEHGIPSVWAIARNKKETGFHLICAAGTHFDPIKATKNALHELSGLMLTLDGKAKKQRSKYVAMIHQPHLVKEMPDHCMLYSIPETEDRLNFLLEQRTVNQTFADIQQPPVSKTDLTEDLRYLIDTCKKFDLDIIVVNQTTSECKRNQLHCVKVLIPGMIPMTFGHHLTRLTGLSRILEVPNKLGYTASNLTLDLLNPHPHPFP